MDMTDWATKHMALHDIEKSRCDNQAQMISLNAEAITALMRKIESLQTQLDLLERAFVLHRDGGDELEKIDG